MKMHLVLPSDFFQGIFIISVLEVKVWTFDLAFSVWVALKSNRHLLWKLYWFQPVLFLLLPSFISLFIFVVDLKLPHFLCSPFHQEVEAIFLLLQCRPAKWLALAISTWWKPSRSAHAHLQYYGLRMGLQKPGGARASASQPSRGMDQACLGPSASSYCQTPAVAWVTPDKTSSTAQPKLLTPKCVHFLFHYMRIIMKITFMICF
jgi:hypothetical protein